MALDVTAVLQELHCVKESEGGSEPYIWPVLLWIDDTTVHNPGDDVLGLRGPLLGEARVVLKQSMKAGENAPIPFPLGSRGVRLEAASGISNVLLVVALFEQDETPQAAMWAGCKRFASELRTAIVQRFLRLKAAVDQGDDDELQRLIDEIKAQVRAAAESATWEGLTSWQKTRYLLGTLNLDDYVGSAFYFGKPGRAQLDLVVKSDSGSDEYGITGTIEAQPTTVDLCQAQADAAAAAQAVVDGIEGQISAAKARYHDASPAEKSTIKAQLEQLNQDLDVAMAALDEARRALQRCRDRWAELAEIRSSSSVGEMGLVNL
jgi:hypothetical protein